MPGSRSMIRAFEDRKSIRLGWSVVVALGIAVTAATVNHPACAQADPPAVKTIGPNEAPTRERAQQMLQARVSNLFAGSVAVDAPITNPLGDNPDVVENGRRSFIQFNCVGCHAPNGGGGEGPALSDNRWIYGGAPANIYLSIVHGRPNGMPAWGAMFPDEIVWELVAYIQSIAEKPDERFGRTISRPLLATKVEQIPAEQLSTVQPWQHTEPFAFGQRPQGVEPGSRERGSPVRQ